MQPGTPRVPKADAERPLKRSHAERGNDLRVGYHARLLPASTPKP